MERRYELVEGWEKRGAAGFYEDAAGVAVGPDDLVYVLTRGPSRILVYDPDGNLHRMIESRDLGTRCHGVTVDSNGRILVADDRRHLVVALDPAGRTIMTLGNQDVPSDTGFDGKDQLTIERGGPPFNRPTNVVVMESASLAVSDGYGNSRVHVFASDGTLVRSFGQPGSAPGQFRRPHGIAAFPDGRIAVADRENDRVQVFDKSGSFLDQWVSVQRPSHLAVDPINHVVAVAEFSWREGQVSFRTGPQPALPSRVSVVDYEGNVLARLGGGKDPAAPGNFIAAHGVAIDSVGSIYVAEVTGTVGVRRGLVPDTCHTLQKFQLIN